MNTSTPQMFSDDEWLWNNQRRFNQSDNARSEWFRINKQSKQLAKEKDILTRSTQDAATEKLAERAKQIFEWKKELAKTIEDMTAEIKKLMNLKKRLENSLNESRSCLILTKESLDLRNQRISSDLVDDQVQRELHRENEIIQTFQDITKSIVGEIDNQIRRNQASKAELERDWSDKFEAYNIDTTCAHLQNTSYEHLAFYTGPERIPHKWSSPQEWIEFTRHNISMARKEMEVSGILRQKTEMNLANGYRDLRHQADTVENSLFKRLNETNDSLSRLKQHLQLVCKDIAEAENTITFLKKQILEKEPHLKKIQTRLHLRNQRPNVELCKDSPHYSLLSESHIISATIQSLQEQLAREEAALSNLLETRRDLEREIAIKENTISIDRDRVQPVRKKFPLQSKLLGY